MRDIHYAAPNPLQLPTVTGANPLTCADYPDVDVIRVDDAYYMVSTTMYFMPGGVILRSYDLLNWEIAAHIYDVLDDTPKQRLEGDLNAYGSGMWAASIRYHQGMFYVVFIANDTGKTYIYRAPSIEGPWAQNTLDGFYYDNSILFDDDGRVYIAHGHRIIKLDELNADLTGLREGGLHRVLVSDDGNPGLGYEGVHLYKFAGRYYLFAIHSVPTHWKRVEACFASDSLTGAFVGCDVLNDDMGYHNQGIAQGGIVDTPQGDWYAVLFQDREAVGRIPLLMPLAWKEGFPVLGVDGKVPRTLTVINNRPGYTYQPLYASDDFSALPLKNVWEFNHIPDPVLWASGKGKLNITTGKLCGGLLQAVNTLTQRTMYPRCAAEVSVDGSGLLDGDFAGLCMLQMYFGQIALKMQGGQRYLSLITREMGDEEAVERACIPWQDATATLKIEAEFEDQVDLCTFWYWKDDAWQQLGGAHKMYFRLEHFTGNRFGLFNYATQRIGGRADFSQFIYHM